MKASLDKVRWALAGGSLMLFLLLIAVVGYGRYRAARLWKNRLNGLGVHLEQTTDNITYSQTVQGRTVFTLKAGKAIQHKNGKVVLHNVVLTLFGKRDGTEDRIYGSEFEYDDKTGVARALGQVEMDLHVPGGVNPGAHDSVAGENGRDVHVRTSGLTYVRKLGVAATDKPVMLSYAGLQCTARGAEFDSGESVVHLLADVQLQGRLRDRPIALSAAKADLDHNENVVTMVNPVLQSGAQRASSTGVVLHLRKDGSVSTAEANGSVLLQKGTQRITAASLNADFSAANVPEQASLSGGVRLDDSSSDHPAKGSAARLDGRFGAKGMLTRWVASGGAQLSAQSRGTNGQMLARALRGDRMEGTMAEGKQKVMASLSQLHVAGGAQVRAEAAAQPTGVETTQVNADDLHLVFAGDETNTSGNLEQVTAQGNTRVEQDAPRGERQVSTSDQLELWFAPVLAPGHAKAGGTQIARATQAGHVHIETQPAARTDGKPGPEPASASADRSEFVAATNKLTLDGNARFQQGATSLSANTLVIDQRSGDSDATGAVQATLERGSGNSVDATHIRSDSAHIIREAQAAEFKGSDLHPARLWQNASQIEAANIRIDGKTRRLEACPESPGGTIHATFANDGKHKQGTAAARAPQVERLSANLLDYDDSDKSAMFSGNVRAQGETGLLQAQNARLFFAGPKPASAQNQNPTIAAQVSPFGGSLERATAWGDVRLSQPGKTGRGDKLVYTSANSTFVLTGSPGHLPQIVDSERGSITGAVLTFRTSDNTVTVSGSSPENSATEHVRVRTETGAKQ